MDLCRTMRIRWVFLRHLKEDDKIASTYVLELREEHGAIAFKFLVHMFVSQFESASHWSIQTWLNHLANGGRPKESFQNCVNPDFPEVLLYFRAIQGHSGGNQIDPSLHDLLVLPNDFTEYIYHVGSFTNLHSSVWTGLIAGGKR